MANLALLGDDGEVADHGGVRVRAELVGWVTGERSVNRTDLRWAVDGTDLGVLWSSGRDTVLAAFGDTFQPRNPAGGGRGGDRRSNVLARSTDRDLSRGMIIESFVTDRDGHAAEILPARKVNGWEKSIIPTAGIHVDGRDHLAYMSVRRWGAPGWWRTNYAGFAYSDDGGRTWAKPIGRGGPTWWNTWRGDQRFQMVALAGHGDHVLIFGTPNGREGSCYLARARLDHLLQPGRHEQWCADGWRAGNPPVDQWHTVPLFGPWVSELSVAWHRPTQRWLATYFDQGRGAIVVRSAPEPTGPWSEQHEVATSAEWPGLYGAYLHPWSMDDPEPLFLMSQWGPYAVAAMRLTDLC